MRCLEAKIQSMEYDTNISPPYTETMVLVYYSCKYTCYDKNETYPYVRPPASTVNTQSDVLRQSVFFIFIRSRPLGKTLEQMTHCISPPSMAIPPPPSSRAVLPMNCAAPRNLSRIAIVQGRHQHGHRQRCNTERVFMYVLHKEGCINAGIHDKGILSPRFRTHMLC